MEIYYGLGWVGKSRKGFHYINPKFLLRFNNEEEIVVVWNSRIGFPKEIEDLPSIIPDWKTGKDGGVSSLLQKAVKKGGGAASPEYFSGMVLKVYHPTSGNRWFGKVIGLVAEFFSGEENPAIRYLDPLVAEKSKGLEEIFADDLNSEEVELAKNFLDRGWINVHKKELGID